MPKPFNDHCNKTLEHIFFKECFKHTERMQLHTIICGSTKLYEEFDAAAFIFINIF